MLAKSRLSTSSIGPSPARERELDDLAEIEAHLDRGEVEKVSKKARYQSWTRMASSGIVRSPLADTEEGHSSSLARSRMSASSILPSPLTDTEDDESSSLARSRMSASDVFLSPLAEDDESSVLTKSRLSSSSIIPSPIAEAEEERFAP